MISFRLRHILPLALAVFLTGCSASSDELQPSEWDSHTYLQLSVSTAESSSPRSRAEGDETTFEPGVGNELIKTMRFIVLDNDGKVEHNIMVYNTTNSSSAQTGVYIVKPNELKQIYLVGNEASLPQTVRDMLVGLSYKTQFPQQLRDFVLERKDKLSPLFASDDLIPMTEFFNFQIDDPKHDDDKKPQPYTANLFITRVPTKVTFNLKLDPAYSTESYRNIEPGSVSFSPISISQFLFPHLTEYNPQKPVPVMDGASLSLQRYITEFETPQTATTSPFEITEWTRTADEDGCRTYTTGSFYLTETPPGKIVEGARPYTVTLNIGDASLSTTLENLPTLPRNTHVIVNMTLSQSELTAVVELVPYIGVELKPSFGFPIPDPEPEQE